jgi:NAD(P)-dependent dehydrogenase (short-subunit alcohol dehydrogenase family)
MKTVFITGASSGIGKAAAVLFQKKGWNVAATMRNPQKETLLSSLKNVRCYPLDITDIDSIRESLASAINDFGSIDVLINNAGVYTTNPLEMTSEKDINQLINGYGPDVTAKTIYPATSDNNFRLRYASGPDTKMVFFFKRVAPIYTLQSGGASFK